MSQRIQDSSDTVSLKKGNSTGLKFKKNEIQSFLYTTALSSDLISYQGPSLLQNAIDHGFGTAAAGRGPWTAARRRSRRTVHGVSWRARPAWRITEAPRVPCAHWFSPGPHALSLTNQCQGGVAELEPNLGCWKLVPGEPKGPPQESRAWRSPGQVSMASTTLPVWKQSIKK